MTSWLRDYVGLPHLRAGRSREGVDCYGLIWLIYRDVLGIALPSYAGETVDAQERAEVAALIAGGSSIAPWQAVELGSEREFDMAIFRRGSLESHVGVVIATGRMLHVVDVGESHVASFVSGAWRNRLVGIRRHEAMTCARR